MSAIASAFDLDCVGTIVVALISGVYYVIDGQHRLEAMRSLDMLDVEVECEIYVDPTMEYAAKLFLALNARKGMKLFDKFEKRVNSGDPVAVDIVETVRSLGLEIHEYLRGAINAVDALERVYLDKRGKRSSPSPSALRTTLRCLRDAWGEDESAYNGNLIKALGAVVRRYDGMIDQENMIRHMVAFPGGPSGLLRRGKELATVKRLATIHAIAEEFVSLYNHRLRSNTLDPWMKSRRP